MVSETNNQESLASNNDTPVSESQSAGMDISIDGMDLDAIAAQEITEPTAGQEPEVVPEVQEVAKTEAEAEVQEKLLAGKFKSQDDLEKAYKELESKYGHTAQERADLQKTLETLAPIFEEAQVEQPVSSMEDSDPQTELKNIVRSAVSEVMAPQQANLAIEKLATKHPDFSEYVDDIMQVVKEMPELITRDKAAGLERAYKIAKADRFEAEKLQAKEEGKKEAYENIVQKSMGSVEGASKAGDKRGPLTIEEFNKLSFEDKEKIIKNLPGISMT